MATDQMTRDTFNSFLRSAGLKATPGRLALLEVLYSAKSPRSIAKIMRELGGKIDRVTAYRALAAMEKTGLVRKVNLEHGHADYELALDDHHHLVCTACGRLEDFGGCDLRGLERKALKQSKYFAEIRQHSLEFFGLCKACAAKSRP